MKDNLLIVGMGQYGLVAKEIAQAMNCFDKISFLDDHNSVAIGKLSDAEYFVGQYHCAIVAIGNSKMRSDCIEQISQYFRLATLIHPKSYVSPSACMGAGCIVEPMAVIHTDVQLAPGCLVSAGAVINHNSCVGAYCHIDCNATVAARMEVPAHTKILSGCVYAGNN